VGLITIYKFIIKPTLTSLYLNVVLGAKKRPKVTKEVKT